MSQGRPSKTVEQILKESIGRRDFLRRLSAAGIIAAGLKLGADGIATAAAGLEEYLDPELAEIRRIEAYEEPVNNPCGEAFTVTTEELKDMGTADVKLFNVTDGYIKDLKANVGSELLFTPANIQGYKAPSPVIAVWVYNVSSNAAKTKTLIQKVVFKHQGMATKIRFTPEAGKHYAVFTFTDFRPVFMGLCPSLFSEMKRYRSAKAPTGYGSQSWFYENEPGINDAPANGKVRMAGWINGIWNPAWRFAYDATHNFSGITWLTYSSTVNPPKSAQTWKIGFDHANWGTRSNGQPYLVYVRISPCVGNASDELSIFFEEFSEQACEVDDLGHTNTSVYASYRDQRGRLVGAKTMFAYSWLSHYRATVLTMPKTKLPALNPEATYQHSGYVSGGMHPREISNWIEELLAKRIPVRRVIQALDNTCSNDRPRFTVELWRPDQRMRSYHFLDGSGFDCGSKVRLYTVG